MNALNTIKKIAAASAIAGTLGLGALGLGSGLAFADDASGTSSTSAGTSSSTSSSTASSSESGTSSSAPARSRVGIDAGKLDVGRAAAKTYGDSFSKAGR
jgi:hypothetical protein